MEHPMPCADAGVAIRTKPVTSPCDGKGGIPDRGGLRECHQNCRRSNQLTTVRDGVAKAESSGTPSLAGSAADPASEVVRPASQPGWYGTRICSVPEGDRFHLAPLVELIQHGQNFILIQAQVRQWKLLAKSMDQLQINPAALPLRRVLKVP